MQYNNIYAIQTAVLIKILFCNNIVYRRGGANMAFQIRPDRKESETKSIRFPLELVERIETAIKGNDVTFSGFVIQACEYALDQMVSEP